MGSSFVSSSALRTVRRISSSETLVGRDRMRLTSAASNATAIMSQVSSTSTAPVSTADCMKPALARTIKSRSAAVRSLSVLSAIMSSVLILLLLAQARGPQLAVVVRAHVDVRDASSQSHAPDRLVVALVHAHATHRAHGPSCALHALAGSPCVPLPRPALPARFAPHYQQ